METNPRFSLYHRRIMHRVYFYLVLNMLIIPGLAVPQSYNLIKFIYSKLDAVEFLFQNFYTIRNADFYITLIINQTGIAFMMGMLQIAPMVLWAFSPSYLLIYRLKIDSKSGYYRQIGNTFDFGYHCAMIMVIMSIVFVYAFGNQTSHSDNGAAGSFLFTI